MTLHKFVSIARDTTACIPITLLVDTDEDAEDKKPEPQGFFTWWW